jgi:hypothetical protein
MKIFLFILFNVNYLLLARAFVLYYRIVKRPVYASKYPFSYIKAMKTFEIKEKINIFILTAFAFYINYLILN